jgi:hypothetical protein
MHYNFARVHKTLRVTPAMQAGLSDHVWSIEEIVATIFHAGSLLLAGLALAVVAAVILKFFWGTGRISN